MERIEQQLEESYNHIKPYLKEQKELKKMCNCCEKYNGTEHDYDECKYAQCFKFYLGYEYLEWCNSFIERIK